MVAVRGFSTAGRAVRERDRPAFRVLVKTGERVG
jgi:hypothetical protein